MASATGCLIHKEIYNEGIVLRKNEDPISEAFKLKTLAFFKREKANIDAGEVDMEMSSSTEGNEEETNI